MMQATKQKEFQSRLDQAISEMQSGPPDPGQLNSANTRDAPSEPVVSASGPDQPDSADAGDAPSWPIASAPNPDQSDTSPSTFDPAVLAHSDQANAAIQRAVDVASRGDQLDEQTDMPPPSVVAEATQDLGRIASGPNEGDPSLSGTATAPSIFPSYQSDPVPGDSPLRDAFDSIKEPTVDSVSSFAGSLAGKAQPPQLSEDQAAVDSALGDEFKPSFMDWFSDKVGATVIAGQQAYTTFKEGYDTFNQALHPLDYIGQRLVDQMCDNNPDCPLYLVYKTRDNLWDNSPEAKQKERDDLTEYTDGVRGRNVGKPGDSQPFLSDENAPQQ